METVFVIIRTDLDRWNEWASIIAVRSDRDEAQSWCDLANSKLPKNSETWFRVDEYSIDGHLSVRKMMELI